MTTIIFLLILVFLIGMYFYAKNGDSGSDGFTNNQSTGPRCPNLLIQKGSRFRWYQSTSRMALFTLCSYT